MPNFKFEKGKLRRVEPPKKKFRERVLEFLEFLKLQLEKKQEQQAKKIIENLKKKENG